MFYETVESLPIVVRKKLPKDALKVFLNAAQVHDNEHDCLVAGWEVVNERWRKSDKPGEKWVKRPIQKGTEEMDAVIIKVDSEQRVAYGWASVISKGGQPVIDTQGDIIEAGELVKATTEFMQDARLAKAMHAGDGIGEVLHSFPLTKELGDSLGISCDQEGWIVGVKIHDDEIWKACKDKKLKAFSIGGKSQRVEAE